MIVPGDLVRLESIAIAYTDFALTRMYLTDDKFEKSVGLIIAIDDGKAMVITSSGRITCNYTMMFVKIE
jgi:hypothetical protein